MAIETASIMGDKYGKQTIEQLTKEKWKPPPVGLVTGRWGFVPRDYNGQAIIAGAGTMSVVHDALSAKHKLV
jgi:hypothetical protein